MIRTLSVEQLLDLCRKNNNCYVFGTANVSSRIIALKNHEQYLLDKVKGFLCSSYDDNPYYIYNKKVNLASSIPIKERADMSVIVAVSTKKINEVGNYLQSLSYEKIFVMDNKFYDNYLNFERITMPYRMRSKEVFLNEASKLQKNNTVDSNYLQNTIDRYLCGDDLNKFFMTRLVVMLGTKCSLKCKDCSNLIPYIKPQCDFELEDIIKALSIILDRSEIILRCELIGGEPFSSKNLIPVLQYLLDSPQICQIELTSNGTITPNAKLLEVIANPKVRLHISSYQKLWKNGKLFDTLEAANINYCVLNNTTWVECGGIEKRGRSLVELKEIYQNCYDAFVCKTLCRGKLFSCARAAGLYLLGKEDVEYLEIDDRLTPKALIDFHEQDVSLACDYCDYASADRKIVEPAIQL